MGPDGDIGVQAEAFDKAFPANTLFVNRDRLARLAIEAKLPAISGWASFAESGLLLNYEPNLRDIYRDLARYVNRILRGARPEDLPVELPRTVELVVMPGPPGPWASRSCRRYWCAPIR